MSDWRLTPAARADLDGIWDYTTQTWGATPSQDAGHVRPGYRKALSGRHVLFYRQGAQGVEVVRILHQRMDVDRQGI